MCVYIFSLSLILQEKTLAYLIENVVEQFFPLYEINCLQILGHLLQNFKNILDE